jgi:hypothetical protein
MTQIGVNVETGVRQMLQDFVQAKREFVERGGRKSPWAYLCMEEYVLVNGQIFTELSPRVYKPGRIKMCFQNARRLVQLTRGHLTYVEGFAVMMSAVPVHHAWNVDPEGRLVDITCQALGVATQATNYCGVPFPDLQQVLEAHEASGTVIDDWQRGWPLLQERPNELG